MIDRGYLILAVNTEDTDYIACARALAMSIKYWHPGAQVCLLTDKDYTHEPFDIVKILPFGNKGGYANDWQVFKSSPFHQTIKLEADMVLTGPIDHWWTMFEQKDVVVSTGCRNFYNQLSTNRSYRRAFDQNNLPDVYNAITYWRFSRLASQFFDTVRSVFDNWAAYRECLRAVDTEEADTDIAYAIAAVILGVEKVTLPDSLQMIHMKAQHNYCSSEPWTKQLVWELDQGNIRINTIAQQYPLHYHVKTFAPELEKHYGQLLASRK